MFNCTGACAPPPWRACSYLTEDRYFRSYLALQELLPGRFVFSVSVSSTSFSPYLSPSCPSRALVAMSGVHYKVTSPVSRAHKAFAVLLILLLIQPLINGSSPSRIKHPGAPVSIFSSSVCCRPYVNLTFTRESNQVVKSLRNISGATPAVLIEAASHTTYTPGLTNDFPYTLTGTIAVIGKFSIF